MNAKTTVSPTANGALRAALQRLANGTPIHTDGTLTVTTLAVEAGVSRSTANRASDIVRDLRHLHQETGNPLPTENADTELRGLRKELTDTKRTRNKTVKALEESIEILAQHVQVLTLDNDRLRKALAVQGHAGATTRWQPRTHAPVR